MVAKKIVLSPPPKTNMVKEKILTTRHEGSVAAGVEGYTRSGTIGGATLSGRP